MIIKFPRRLKEERCLDYLRKLEVTEKMMHARTQLQFQMTNQSELSF